MGRTHISFRRASLVLVLLSSLTPLQASSLGENTDQGRRERVSTSQSMTLQSVVDAARKGSVAAIAAKASFVSSYWAWRSQRLLL